MLPPVDADLITPEWIAEAELSQQSSTTFSQTSVTLRECAVIVSLSQRLIKSAFVDIGAHIRD